MLRVLLITKSKGARAKKHIMLHRGVFGANMLCLLSRTKNRKDLSAIYHSNILGS